MARISDSEMLYCKKLYEEDNLSCAEISRLTGIGEATVRRRLKELGVEIVRYRHAGKFEVSDVIKQYNHGITIQ